MGWKNLVRVEGETEFCEDGLIFTTKEEADGYGRDLFSRWMLVEENKSVEVEEKANYKWENGKATCIEEGGVL